MLPKAAEPCNLGEPFVSQVVAGTFLDKMVLIDRATQLLQVRHTQDGRVHGDVGAVVVSERGHMYEGVCVDTPSWGLCAERSALAAMITAGEYRFQQVVAVWRNETTGEIHVLPPCGVCREFMRQIDSGNLSAEVILGADQSRPLRDLLPEHAWPPPLHR
ncbi:hypothetical protein [Devosia soli]|uniref:cytidine deaminase family protein n=1 Tax=Devosia soli TaxID=361041 RepID=UPI0009FC6317